MNNDGTKKVFGSLDDYPFTQISEKFDDSDKGRKKKSRKMNGFQRQIKKTKYKISRGIVGL